MSSLSAQQIWQHFSYAVHQVFSRWTALQLAVEQGFGGRNSRDKAIHLEQTVLAYIHSKHGNVDRDDLALILEDEMDEKFNVLLSEEGADRSHEEITKVLLDFGVALQRGDLAEFNRLLSLMPGQANTAGSIAAPDQEDIMMEDPEALSEALETMNIQPGNMTPNVELPHGESSSSSDSTPRRARNEPDADGWTVVSGSGKRRPTS